MLAVIWYIGTAYGFTAYRLRLYYKILKALICVNALYCVVAVAVRSLLVLLKFD